MGLSVVSQTRCKIDVFPAFALPITSTRNRISGIRGRLCTGRLCVVWLCAVLCAVPIGAVWKARVIDRSIRFERRDCADHVFVPTPTSFKLVVREVAADTDSKRVESRIRGRGPEEAATFEIAVLQLTVSGKIGQPIFFCEYGAQCLLSSTLTLKTIARDVRRKLQ